jgi:hypothetical protein
MAFKNKEMEVEAPVSCIRLLARTEVTYESDEESVHEEVDGYDVGH